MQIKDFINRLDDNRRRQLAEVMRFGMVGVVATVIQVAVYNLLLTLLNELVANLLGYIVSLTFNYFASTYFTFRVKASASRGAGFLLSHAVNLTLQTVSLSTFLHLGAGPRVAQLLMFCVCVPVNFMLVRFFMTRGRGKKPSESTDNSDNSPYQ